MRQEYDYEKILANVKNLYPKLDQPAKEGDLLRVYTAMALQQELVLDAVGALTAMVSNDSPDVKLRRFGETFQNASNFVNEQMQALLKKSEQGSIDNE